MNGPFCQHTLICKPNLCCSARLISLPFVSPDFSLSLFSFRALRLSLPLSTAISTCACSSRCTCTPSQGRPIIVSCARDAEPSIEYLCLRSAISSTGFRTARTRQPSNKGCSRHSRWPASRLSWQCRAHCHRQRHAEGSFRHGGTS